jgi:hypothetical protein
MDSRSYVEKTLSTSTGCCICRTRGQGTTGGRFLDKDARTCGSAHFVLKAAADAATAQVIYFG